MSYISELPAAKEILQRMDLLSTACSFLLTNKKDIVLVGVVLQVVLHASYDCTYVTWGFEGCSKRQLSWGFHLTMNDAYERKQPSSLEITQLTNAVIYFFQVIVNIVSSAFAMCKCRLTWDLRLRRYCIKHKHEVLTFGPAFDVSSSQSGTHF